MKRWVGMSFLIGLAAMLGSSGGVQAQEPDDPLAIYEDLVVDETRGWLFHSYIKNTFVTVLRLSDLSVETTIPVGGGPWGMDISPDGSTLAVAVASRHEIVLIDLNTLNEVDTCAPEPGTPWYNLSDVVFGSPPRLYAGGYGFVDKLYAFELGPCHEVGRTFTSVDDHPTLAITDDGNTLYSSQWSGFVHRWDVTGAEPVQTGGLCCPSGAQDIAIKGDGSEVYIGGTAWSGDLTTNLGSYAGGNSVTYVASSDRIYVANYGKLTEVNAADGFAKMREWLYPGLQVPVVRIDESENFIYLSTAEGLKKLMVGTHNDRFLPAVMHHYFLGIYGFITLNKEPIAGIPVDLRFFNGNVWSTADSTTTDSQGLYFFPDAAQLAPGQEYYVRYQGNQPGRLSFWGTQVLNSYYPFWQIEIGSFDLKDIPLVSPSDGSDVNFPETFTWGKRIGFPTDNYVYAVYDASDLDPFGTTSPLGFVNSVTIFGLPASFEPGKSYTWEMWTVGADGSVGISFNGWDFFYEEDAPAAGPGDLVIPAIDPELLIDILEFLRGTRH